MEISVIVPVYNVERYLDRCVDSILRQTMADFELILVDDGSTDGSGAMCDAYTHDERVRVIHQENKGLGLARNTGLEYARGEYVCFIDSDDYTGPELLENLFTAARRHRADIVIGGWTDVYANGREKRHVYPELLFDTEADRRKCILGCVAAPPESREDVLWSVSAWAKLYRRDVIEQYGLCFVSERVFISEDIIFTLDSFSQAARIAIVPETSYHYCVTAGSLSKRYRADRFERNLEMYEVVRQRLVTAYLELEYQIYLDRFLISKARYCITQEVLYHDKTDRSHDMRAGIRRIAEDNTLREILGRYPWRRMPLKQGIFTLLMKRRLYFLMVWAVRLKQRFLGSNQSM